MTSRADYEAYTEMLDRQYAEASQLLSDYIDSFDWDVDYETAKAQRDIVAQYMHGLVDVYGNNAATLAADFFEQATAEAGVAVWEPALADLPTLEQMLGSTRYSARALWGRNRDVDAFRANCLAAMKRYVKGCATQTMAINAKRSGKKGLDVRWARVPRGAETCAFCIMLASRGFVYYSEQSAELFEHEHEHCDCDVIPSFTDAGLEGYDESYYRALYDANVQYDMYGHVSTRKTLRNIRESVYDEQKEHINEVRRAWYSRNAEKERERARRYRERKRRELAEKAAEAVEGNGA